MRAEKIDELDWNGLGFPSLQASFRVETGADFSYRGFPRVEISIALQWYEG